MLALSPILMRNLLKNTFKNTFKNTHFTWLRILLITLLVIGVFFRLVNLDLKVYWYDEGFTSLRVGGYTISEVVQQSFNGKVISVADFRDRYLSPDSGRGFYGTLKSLAVEDPQHPPLYYLMAHLWMQWFGNSVAAIRSLPALISLLIFPCVYWLCIELFNPLTGWIAMAIIAVSPFHVLEAQEAREYSLWTVTILLASASLLRAMRLKTVNSWAIYALTLTTSLYTFLFSVFIAIGHGIYVISCENFRSKIFIAYLKATFISCVAFLPWIWVVINNSKRLNDSTSWMTSNAIPLLQLADSSVKNIGSIFLKSTKFDVVLLTAIIILVGYSFYFICRHTPKTVWLFILTLFGVTALALLLPDIIYGGQRAIQARFLIPCYLSIQLAVSYLIATKISLKLALWQQKFWLFVMVAIFTGGVISSAIFSQSEVPWTKLKNYRDYKIARTINQASNPLVVMSNYPSLYDPNVSSLFSFSHLLDAKVKLQLVDGENIPKIPEGFSNIFIYNPCAISTEKQGLANEFKVLLSELKQQNYQAKPVKISQPVLLWRLEKTNVNSHLS